MQIKVGNSQ